MAKTTYILLIVCLSAVLSHLSEAYSTKGHQSFSHSYSSSSASAHSSSYSSSGSYSFGDKSTLPIIGPIPIAAATATASASAGSSAAIANSAAIAGAEAGSTALAGHNKNNGGGTYAGTASSGTYGSQNKALTQGSGDQDESTILRKPPCCKKIPPGPNGSIYDYKVPSEVNTISGASSGISGYGQSQTGSYGGSEPASQVPSSGYNPGQSGSYGGSKPATQFPSAGYGHSHTRPGSSGSTIIELKPSPGYGPGQTGSYGGSKPSSQFPSSGYGHTSSGSSGANVIAGQTTSGYGSSNTGSYGQPLWNTGSYGSNKQPGQGADSATPVKKPCCKGPFPGPNGSIYDSKPASAVGTHVKAPGAEELPKPSIPLHRPPVNFPGPSGSIYTSKPVNSIGNSGSYQPSIPAVRPGTNLPGPSGQGYGNKPVSNYQPSGSGSVDVGGYHSPGSSIPRLPSSSDKTIITSIKEYPSTGPAISGSPSAGQYGSHSSSQAVAAANANSYQTQYQGSSDTKPSCSQGVCNKEPPRTYLQPPQTQEKPVTENDNEQPVPQVIPGSGYNPSRPVISIVPVVKPETPAPSEYSPNTAYNTDKTIPVSGSEGSRPYGSGVQVTTTSSYNKPHGSGYVQPQPIPGGVQKQDGSGAYQGSFSASSATAGSSSYSGSVVGYHKTNSGSTNKDNEGKTLYVSGPGSTAYNPDKPGSHFPSVTENTIAGSGLHEGPRGPPSIPTSYPKKSDYDESKGDSAIVFVDSSVDGPSVASAGSYSSGRGYSSSSAVASSSSGSGVYNKGSTNVYSSNIDSSYSKVPGTTTNNGQGVVVIGTSSGSHKLYGGSISGGSYGSSGSYGGSSIGHKDIPCTGGGCNIPYRKHSNAVPSEDSNILIQINSVPSGSGSSHGSRGPYGAGAAVPSGSPCTIISSGSYSGSVPSGCTVISSGTINGVPGSSVVSSGSQVGSSVPSGSPCTIITSGSYTGGPVPSGCTIISSGNYSGGSGSSVPSGSTIISSGSYGGPSVPSGSGSSHVSRGPYVGGVSVPSGSGNSIVSSESYKGGSVPSGSGNFIVSSGSYGGGSVPSGSGSSHTSSGTYGGGSSASGSGSSHTSSGTYGGGSSASGSGNSHTSSGTYGGGSVPSGSGSSHISSGTYGGGSAASGSGSTHISSGSYGGGSVPSSSGSSYASSGSYGGGAHGAHTYSGAFSGKTGGGYGSSHAVVGGIKGGSGLGSYGASSASSGHDLGSGGFLSSIFPVDGSAAHTGVYSKAGGYSSSSSFAKASSYASSSSFASSSSGSYSSSHI